MSRRQVLRGVMAGTAFGLLNLAITSTRAAAAPPTTRLGAGFDLSHEFYDGFPSFPPLPPPKRTPLSPQETAPAPPYVQEWTFVEHSGTHVDAPGHFVPGGALVHQLPLSDLVLALAVVDISGKVFDGSGNVVRPDAVLEVDDLDRWQRSHGVLPRRCAVVMSSGWDRFADRTQTANPSVAYRNVGIDGRMHFPGFSLDAVDWLLQHPSDVRCIGVDTLSLDPGMADFDEFVVHSRWLSSGRIGLENVANLAAVPRKGTTLVIGVPRFELGSGGPCRLLAFG